MFIIFLCTYIKTGNKYCQKNKEKLQKEVWERYQNLSEEEKEKKHNIISIGIRIILKKKNKRKFNIWEIII